MRVILPGLFGLLTPFFAWLWYERYWKWRHCIAAVESSCVLPDGDNLTGAGMVWGMFAILFAIATVAALWLSRRR